MADEVVAGAGGTPGGDGGGSGGGMSAADISAPGGDVAFLAEETPASSTAEAAPIETKPADEKDGAAKATEEAAPEEIDLSALEEGQPEWLAKVTDPVVKGEVEKLLEVSKKFSEHFKDAADIDEFFKELPGGREQVAALQTLSKEVGDLDTALESNTPEGNAQVAERYLAMTPDGGAGILRACAQHMAKANPESWHQISSELINSTLHAGGIGTDLNGLLSGISEMRAAIAADDGEAFGRAAGKLLGAPKQEPKTDPNLARLTERETAARNEATKAQTESWQFRSEKSGDKIVNHLATETGKLLARVLPNSISDKDRTTLRSDIASEVMSQLVADPWLSSQVKQLIGWSAKGDKGPDFSNANLKASQAEFDKATELVLQHASGKMITKAVSKVVTKWSRERAAGNQEARAKAKSSATRTDVGAGKTPGVASSKVSVEQMRAKNADGSYKVSDEEFLGL